MYIWPHKLHLNTFWYLLSKLKLYDVPQGEFIWSAQRRNLKNSIQKTIGLQGKDQTLCLLFLTWLWFLSQSLCHCAVLQIPQSADLEHHIVFTHLLCTLCSSPDELPLFLNDTAQVAHQECFIVVAQLFLKFQTSFNQLFVFTCSTTLKILGQRLCLIILNILHSVWLHSRYLVIPFKRKSSLYDLFCISYFSLPLAEPFLK